MFGKTALVTGGASGLGLATVKKLHARGAQVLIFDLPSSDGKKIADNLAPNVRFHAGDVTNEEDVKNAVTFASQNFGSLQVLVNCAGIGPTGRILDSDGNTHSMALFKKVMDINLTGSFLMMCHAAKMMSKNKESDTLDLTDVKNPNVKIEQKGVVINVSSIARSEGQMDRVAYAASKAAISGMTLPAARDLASSGIRVCCIAPGVIRTPIMEKVGISEEQMKEICKIIPFPQRYGDPAYFADLVCTVIDNPYLNGETIRLDGAVRM